MIGCMTEMNEVVRVPDNDMRATVRLDYEETFKALVYSTGTFGNIEFWSAIYKDNVAFNPLCGTSVLRKENYEFVPVTINSDNLPATVDKSRGTVEKIEDISDSVIEAVERIGWVPWLSLSGISGYLASINLSVLVQSAPNFQGVLWLMVLIIAATSFVFGGDVLLESGSPFLKTKPVVQKPKLGEFPVKEKFLAMSPRTGAVTKMVLETANSSLMNSLVERKLEIERDHEEFTKWIYGVWRIVDNDPDFPIDAIPLLTDETVKVSTDLMEQLRIEREAVKMADEQKFLAVSTEDRIVDSHGIKILEGFARADSIKASEIAQQYLDERRSKNVPNS